jgi:hypothetical protein
MKTNKTPGMGSCNLAWSALLMFFFSVTWADEQSLVRVSRDPYPADLAQHATEVAPVMVANGDTVVSAFQVGRNLGAGADNIGWATSKDGGHNWHRGFLSGTTPVAGGTWPAISQPSIAYDRKHKVYLIAMMPFDGNGNGRGALISRSKDGISWSQPSVAAVSLGSNTHWLACDNSTKSPYYGNCYDAFLDYSSPIANVNVLVASHDGGLTWGGPVMSPDQSANVVASMAIQPNGHLVVLGRTGGPNFDQEYAIPSVDGGTSLGATANIATDQFMYPWMKADPNPTSGVDARGTIYVVFADCRFRANCVDPGCRFGPSTSFCATNDLVITKSKDGVHWSTPQRIPVDPITSSIDHLIPGLAVLNESENSDGESDAALALTYYYLPNGNLPDGSTCSTATCEVSAGYVTSEDGGSTWHHAVKVAGPMAQSWLVPTFAGEMVADVGTAVFVDGKPFGAFALARTPDPNTGTLDEAIYVAQLQ